jgi:hypothetical protein
VRVTRVWTTRRVGADARHAFGQKKSVGRRHLRRNGFCCASCRRPYVVCAALCFEAKQCAVRCGARTRRRTV